MLRLPACTVRYASTEYLREYVKAIALCIKGYLHADSIRGSDVMKELPGNFMQFSPSWLALALWNIVLPWNSVLTRSKLIFQTSREHLLVPVALSTWRAFYAYLTLIIAIDLLLLQRTRSNNYHYHHAQYRNTSATVLCCPKTNPHCQVVTRSFT
jgi:hypothetical protein